jgi:hypothetical protein
LNAFALGLFLQADVTPVKGGVNMRRNLGVALVMPGLGASDGFAQGGIAGRLRGLPGEGEGPVHRVESGETFPGVAERYGVSVEELMKANDLRVCPRRLEPGRSLRLPPGSAARRSPPSRARRANGARRAVDELVRASLDAEQRGDRSDALALMRQAVESEPESAKAHYFLARQLAAELESAGDPAARRRARSAWLASLRAARDLREDRRDPSNSEYGVEASRRLAEHSAATPLINQHAAGGTYPWGYCAIAALRSVLRHEGLQDPGADTVALRGARPYIRGQGSDGARLDDRARELGLDGASFSQRGTLAGLRSSIDDGRPVMLGGEGVFVGRFSDDARRQRPYREGHWMVAVGYKRDAEGRLTHVVLNDPDTGRRITQSRKDFLRFFSVTRADGGLWQVSYPRS